MSASTPATSSARRSCRQRKSLSALELLGISSKSASRSSKSPSDTQCKETGSKLSHDEVEVTCLKASVTDDKTPSCDTQENALPKAGQCTPVTSDDLTNLERNESGRARPVPHLVMGSDLQDVISRLQPTDLIDEHIEFKSQPGGRRRELMYCKHCGVHLRHRHQFRKHIKLHPEVDYKPFHCPFCDYKAQIRAQIARHINVHSSTKPFICTECGRGFNFKQKLQIHMKYHADVRDQQCPICRLSFHEFKTLKNHLRKIHDIPNTKEFLQQILPFVAPDEATVGSISEAASNQDNVNSALTDSQVPTSASSKEVDETSVVSSQLASSEMEDTRRVIDGANIDMSVVNGTDLVADIRCLSASEVSTANGYILADTAVVVDGNFTDCLDNADCKNQHENEVGAGMQQTVGKLSAADTHEGADGVKEMNLEFSSRRTGRRKFGIYGTCKTNIQTNKYKFGILPGVKSESGLPRKHRSWLQNWRGYHGRFVNNQRIVSSDQISDSLKQYCTVMNSHPDYPEYKVIFVCKLCTDSNAHPTSKSVFPSKTQFACHLETVHPDVRAWQCERCSYQCRLRTSLIVHMKTHTAHPTHVCEICGKSFLFKQKLTVHVRQHLNRREFTCSMCTKSFNELGQLRQHINRVHMKADRPYSCHLCDKTYKDELHLKRHLESHSDVKQFQCDVCKKLYKSKMSLAQHVKSHNCIFQCELCDREFGSYSGFMGHKIMHNESYLGYQCDKCSKVLHTKGSMNRHNKIVHGNLRPFKCHLCSKAFKTKKDLQSHGMVHAPEKRFECSLCAFQCKRVESLRVHMRVHDAVKPYGCVLCGKEYTQKQSLEIHLCRHLSKPVVCAACDVSLNNRYEIAYHMRQVHNTTVLGLGDQFSASTVQPKLCETATGVQRATASDGDVLMDSRALGMVSQRDAGIRRERVSSSRLDSGTCSREMTDEQYGVRSTVNASVSCKDPVKWSGHTASAAASAQTQSSAQPSLNNLSSFVTAGSVQDEQPADQRHCSENYDVECTVLGAVAVKSDTGDGSHCVVAEDDFYEVVTVEISGDDVTSANSCVPVDS